MEAYLYSLRSTMEDTLKDKIDESDKETLGAVVKDALSWLEEHDDEDKGTYEEKRKEIESIANPIISKAYGAAAGAPPGGDMPNMPDQGDDEGSGPTVEEVE